MSSPSFKVKNTPENLNKLQCSYNVERLEEGGGYIHVWLIPITEQFVQSKQLTINYIKKQILK